MKMMKSRKALSPVVASIILIAVTVAVSIAVAAWMGALTFTFMGTEELRVTNVGFSNVNGTKSIMVTVNNTGTNPVTINEAWVNGAKQTSGVTFSEIGGTVSGNKGMTITISPYTWQDGANYQIRLVSSKGNQFTYPASAPNQ
jgi:flagellin-like protein